jgi:hypothetical protein
MNLDVVIQHPDQYIVVWHESWSGVDENGKNITVDVRNSVSVKGAIAMQREIYTKKKPELLKELSTLDQLIDFMAVNWALIAPKESE